MKNRFFICLLTVAAFALGLASCQRDELTSGDGQPTEVTISVAVPNSIVVKSDENPGDGQLVNRCILEIYEDGTLFGEPHYADVNGLSAEFEAIRLITGRTYDFVFWADYAEGSAAEGFEDVHYNTADGLTSITVIADNYMNNEDRMDAFYGCFSHKVEKAEELRFGDLKRPFGRLNLFTLDLAAIPSNIDLSKVMARVSLDKVPAGFNALDGSLSSERISITPKAFSVPVNFPAPGEEPAASAQITYDYIFASKIEDETVVEFTLSLEADGKEFCADFSSPAGIRQNYNTNMSANFLTKPVDIIVDIDPIFEDEKEEPIGPQEISIEDFLALPEGETYYQLTGEVISIANNTWGNLTIKDESGEVYVYGVAKDEASVGGDPTFSGLGIEVGDILTIAGKRASYNGNPQVGDAYYISHDEGQQGGGDEEKYTSLAEIREMAPASTSEKATIADGVTIKAFVISNVEINNLTSKKNVFVQDETAGLQIRFTSDAAFAFGDEVEIDLSGQELSYFSGALQANNVPNEAVTVLSSDNAIVAKEVTVAEFMNNTYDAQYVALPDVQVTEADLGKTFVVGGAHTSINVEDKTGNSFVIFSSKYTTFGDEQVPQGAGVLKGISMINNGKMQIGLTSLEDCAGMTGERFEGQGGGEEPGPGVIEEITISEFLSKPEGETYYQLTGEVISIANSSWGNLTIKDESGEVYVYGVAKDEASVGGDPSFSGLGIEVGDILTIAGKRASYNGSPQVGDAYYIDHEKGQGGGEEPGPEPGGDWMDELSLVGGSNYSIEDATINGTATKVLKLGTSKSDGDATITIPAGTTKITMYCVAWKGKSGGLALSGNCTITPSEISPASNTGASNNAPYTMTVSDSDKYEFTVSGCTSDTEITLQSDARVILWDVQAD